VFVPNNREGYVKKQKSKLYFYIENGVMIFTEAYLLKRGYCCKCGCRHCPYGYKKENHNKLERR
jgi:hypothetical protein